MRTVEHWPPPWALLRLLRRWYTLVTLWVVVMALGVPALFLGDDGFAILAGERVSDSRSLVAGARQLVLHAGATVPLAFATMVTIMSHEIYATSMSWTLPGLRRKLLSGHLLLMLLTTLLVGVGGYARTDALTALTAAGLAPFWYAVGASWTTLFLAPRRFTVLLVLAFAVLLRPSWYAALVTTSPSLFVSVVLAACATVSLIRLQMNPVSARAVMQISASRAALNQAVSFGPVFNRLGASLAGVVGGTRRTLLHWVHAAFVENSRSVAAALGWRALFAIVMASFVYLTNSSLGILGMTFAQAGLQLSGLFAYPLSRRERADVQFVCCLIDVMWLAAIVGGMFALLDGVGVDRSRFNEYKYPMDWRVEIGALVAFAPLAQWSRALGPMPVTAIAARIVPMGLIMFAIVLSQQLLRKGLGNPPVAVSLAILGAVAIVVHLTHLLALRDVYARRDLSVS